MPGEKATGHPDCRTFTSIPGPITASAADALLSEEELFNCRLEKPVTKTGNHSYPTTKRGSIPFNPQQVEIVSLQTFLAEHEQFRGSNEKVANTLPPVDWKCKLFSESDDRADLRNKVYLPLSRVLAPRGISFGQDSDFVHPEGLEDSVVIDAGGAVQVVIEEKSESLIKTLLPEHNPTSFAKFCIDGRKDFLLGKPTQTSHPRFACPLILSQLLGYMHSSRVCRGIFITAGRAVFVWIEPVQEEKVARRAKKKPRKEKKIYVTEELFVDHPSFLRIMASFLVSSFAIDGGDSIRAASLLVVKSEEGGFSDGGTQKHTPTTQFQGQGPLDTKPAGRSSSGNTKGKEGVPQADIAVALGIPQLSHVPDFKESSMLATALGRERRGKVIGTTWNCVPAAVKLVYMDGNDQRYTRDLFHSEVEAYRIAGTARLWGKAVPGPLFTVETDSVCALGMVAGISMPLDPLEWTEEDLQQAKESVLLLLQSGITLTDIKPANFVKLTDSNKANGNVKRVVAIDLEGFSRDDIDVELPPWLLREGTPVLIANDSCS